MTDTDTPLQTEAVPAPQDAAAPKRASANRRGRGGAKPNNNNNNNGSSSSNNNAAARPARKVHPALEKLFELYPKLFGARFLPLKLGVFQELLDKHPDDFKKEELKVALGLHARSTRYLEAVAAGLQRHDLDGNAVEPVAPEHVHHAILELHRRRAQRSGEDLRPQLVARIARAVEASGLDREAYAVLVRSRDEETNAVLDEALAELAQQAAKREALLRAFEASGRASEQEFAEMYGMDPAEVAGTLARARADRQQQQQLQQQEQQQAAPAA